MDASISGSSEALTSYVVASGCSSLNCSSCDERLMISISAKFSTCYDFILSGSLSSNLTCINPSTFSVSEL